MRISREPAADVPIDPSKTALVVVDMQIASASPEGAWVRLQRALGRPEAVTFAERLATVVPAIARLLIGCRAAGVRIVFLRVGRDPAKPLPPRVARRVAQWQAAGLPVPYLTPDAPEYAILPELAPEPGELIVDKTTAGAFASTDLAARLRAEGVTTLLFVGVGTNYCVESTLRGAFDHGFDCVLIEDGCGAWTPEIHATALRSMAPFCGIHRVDEVLAELGSVGVAAGG
ncbi:MAG: cysteine hydrolase [Chloroflexi bacterium]|nr:cysteine hydrolase [Chloroflexota bacterium]